MAKITISDDKCKGCGLCTAACPKKLITIDSSRLTKKGYNPAKFDENGGCVGCAMCAMMCPDVAITVEK